MTLQTALNWQKLYQITPTLKNCFLRLKQPLDIIRLKSIAEKFVGSAFFELILVFYPFSLLMPEV